MVYTKGNFQFLPEANFIWADYFGPYSAKIEAATVVYLSKQNKPTFLSYTFNLNDRHKRAKANYLGEEYTNTSSYGQMERMRIVVNRLETGVLPPNSHRVVEFVYSGGEGSRSIMLTVGWVCNYDKSLPCITVNKTNKS